MNTDSPDTTRIRSYSITALAACIALASLVIGCGGGGKVSTSRVIRNTIPSVSAPASFIALASSASVSLMWSPVSGIDSFSIYRATSPLVTKATGSLLVSGLSPISTTYSDSTVTPGQSYYYVMTSVKGSVESAESPVVTATPGSPAGTIQGMILYEDKEYGQGNFTGVTRWKPVRYADVDVVSTVNGSVIYSTQTDSQGKYALIVAPSADFFKMSVNSTATPTGGTGSISVRSLSNSLYGVPSDRFPLSVSAGVSIGITAENIASGAFNILDVMTIGYDFVKYHDGTYPVVPLDVYWPWSSDPQSTFFCFGGCIPGDGIYVLDVAGDTDQFDDDVLWHEFGHFLAHNYSIDQSEGGPHRLSDVDHDLRFSWSEGWGNFVPGAIKSWLAATEPSRLSTAAGLAPTLYVDTPIFAFDFGSASMSLLYSYASGETAVAKVLHGMRAAFSMQDVWQIFSSFTTAVTATRPPNLELFWDRWLASYPTTSSAARAIFAERQILYQADAYEADDSLMTANSITVGISQSDHTVYADSDWDHVQFTPTAGIPYTIRTSSLRNGADTYLELYDNFGSFVTSNDNTSGLTYSTTPFNCSPTTGICRENGSDLLGSTISLPASSVSPTGPYTIRVYSSANKPNSAGRYGTYNLIVTSP